MVSDTKKEKRSLVLLLILVALFSTTGIFSKLASTVPFLSFRFCLYYGLMILVLGIYAIGWQQVIKTVSINMAGACKALGIIWSLVWGKFFFNEEITLGKVIGIAVVIGGVLLFVLDDKEMKKDVRSC